MTCSFFDNKIKKQVLKASFNAEISAEDKGEENGMGQVLRIGSVGTSKIMEAMQEAIRMTPGMETRVIGSRSLERGKEFARKVGIENAEVCDCYEQMIRREDIDIIYIASPNVYHARQTMEALEQGKHVIVEKPAAVKAEDVRAMAEAARRNGVFFFEAISTIFMPNYLRCKELLWALGKLKKAEFCFGRVSSQYENYLQGKMPSAFDPAMEGGALNDMGIYCIHTMLDLFGAPEKTDYQAEYDQNGVDLMGVLTAEYPGITCRLITAKDRAVECGTRLEGENGWFAQKGTMNDFVNCEASIHGTLLPIKQQGKENRLTYELARFRDAINEKDTAFFEKMCWQSEAAADILEKSHGSRNANRY